jgi:hypothetical protein
MALVRWYVLLVRPLGHIFYKPYFCQLGSDASHSAFFFLPLFTVPAPSYFAEFGKVAQKLRKGSAVPCPRSMSKYDSRTFNSLWGAMTLRFKKCGEKALGSVRYVVTRQLRAPPHCPQRPSTRNARFSKTIPDPEGEETLSAVIVGLPLFPTVRHR